MKKDILCDNCKNNVGSIQGETYVECDDRFYGVEILCKECKEKKEEHYWKYRSKDVNIMFDNQVEY